MIPHTIQLHGGSSKFSISQILLKSSAKVRKNGEILLYLHSLLTNDDESLHKEIESGFSRMLMIRFGIEHLTGKEAIELVRQRNI